MDTRTWTVIICLIFTNPVPEFMLICIYLPIAIVIVLVLNLLYLPAVRLDELAIVPSAVPAKAETVQSGGSGSAGLSRGSIGAGCPEDRRLSLGARPGAGGDGRVSGGRMYLFRGDEAGVQKAPGAVLRHTHAFGGEPGLYPGVSGYPAVLSGFGMG